ncbi:MAG TPA: signal recognition particle-docking protein FtsY, partial [Xanthomonadaceae bacterium]|nr:signal recognition particle-docking protein FtsY [Xanthomonadaceae bacterium]
MFDWLKKKTPPPTPAPPDAALPGPSAADAVDEDAASAVAATGA